MISSDLADHRFFNVTYDGDNHIVMTDILKYGLLDIQNETLANAYCLLIQKNETGLIDGKFRNGRLAGSSMFYVKTEPDAEEDDKDQKLYGEFFDAFETEGMITEKNTPIDKKVEPEKEDL